MVTVVTRLNVGGPSRVVTILATRLEPGLRGPLLTGRGGQREGSLLEEALESGARVVEVPGLRREIAPLADLRALFWLVGYLRRERPRLVATHLAKAGTLGRLAAILAGVPIRVHTFHGHVLEGYFGTLPSAFFRALERVLGRYTTWFVAVSPHIAADLERMGIGRDRTSIIPLGLQLASADPAAATSVRRELAGGADHLVGMVGRLVPIKAPEVFLEAASLLNSEGRRVAFAVVGDGELWDPLHRRASALGLRDTVTFTGWRHDLAEVYRALDVVVCCSDREGTPSVLLEAGAASRPVVATRVGGVPDIIADGVNGLLVPPRDAQGLAAAIGSLLDDPGRRERLGRTGRERVLRDHGVEALIAEYDGLYRRLLEER